jgi:galactokinase
LLRASRIEAGRFQLAQQMAAAERYVGTQGGGMDQTVCLCAEEGSALRIDFTPFGYTPVPVPRDWTFLVGHSGVVADKSLGARERYNSTHGRCDAALEALGLPDYPAALGKLDLVDQLPRHLRGPYRHVLTEAQRVEQAVTALLSNDFDTFGRLMNESHASMRDDLAASVGEADELAGAFLAAGAAGARITGAGFGGCVVALCRRDSADAVAQALGPRVLFEAHPAAAAGPVEV